MLAQQQEQQLAAKAQLLAAQQQQQKVETFDLLYYNHVLDLTVHIIYVYKSILLGFIISSNNPLISIF